jgi:hypothetical protein
MFSKSKGLLLGLLITITISKSTAKNGEVRFSYDDLPSEAVFPGPWDDYIQAPANKSYIRPIAVKSTEGDVSNAIALVDGNGEKKPALGPSGLMILEFAQNIAGR